MPKKAVSALSEKNDEEAQLNQKGQPGEGAKKN